jgi:hypothetical protein
MFGTLIGIFITSAGIVIGADTVLWGSSAPDPTRVDKTCMPSVRSVATLEGWYGERLYLHQHFQDICQELARSVKPISLEGQADRLVQKLQQKYKEHTGNPFATRANLPPPSTKHIASVVVAGFEGTTPLVTVREIRWEKTRKGQWRLVAERVGKLSFQGCGVKFLGEDGVAALLLDTSPHFEQEKHRPEVQAAIRVNRLHKEDNCFSSSLTIEDAKSLYKIVVRLTIDHGDQFMIQNGTVGGRLHLLTIPPAGPIEEELVDPEQYVG